MHRDRGSFDQTVHALVETLVDQHGSAGCHDRHVDAISAFVLETHAAMPDYLRVGFRILTLIFGLSSYAVQGRPFHRLETTGRTTQINAWESSQLQFRRSLMQFYRTFTVFGLYSDLYDHDYDFHPASGT